LAVALAAAAVAIFFVSFATTTCNAEPAVVARKLQDLRHAMVIIGCVVSLAPAGWALLAHRLKMAVLPWVAVAAIVLVVMFVAAARTNETGTFCLF
jgi:hypothetical protein